MSRTRIISSSFSFTLKELVSDPDWFVSVTIAPLIFAAVGLVVLQLSGKPGFVLVAVFGSGVAGMWGTTLFGAGNSLNRERWMGTLEYTVVVPAKLSDIVTGKALAYALIGLGVMLEVLLIAGAMFGVPLGIGNLPAFLLALLLTVLSFSVLGLVLSSFFVLTREANAIANTLEGFVFAVCGVMYPVSVLPAWVQVISYSISPTWGMSSIRHSLVEGFAASDFLTAIGLLLGTSAAYLFASRLLFRVVEHRVRIKGDLSSY